MARTATDRGRQARQQLLDAAIELIPEIGWNAVSTRNLAERAGVRPGLVHYHFPSLQALLSEAALAAVRGIVETVPGLLAGAETAQAGVDRLLVSLDGYSGTDPASLLFVETYLAATRDGELRARLLTLLAEVRSAVTGSLAGHGQQFPERTAAVLLAAIDGVMVHRALDPGLTSATVAPVLRRLVGQSGSEKDKT